MNTNVEKAIFDLSKAEAIMYAMEKSYADIEVKPESRKQFNYEVGAFYALWDAIRKVSEDLEKMREDETVIEAIYAVNGVNRDNSSLKTE